MKPFDDNSFEIDGLTVESAADRVAIYGTLDVSLDQAGLDKAERLAGYLNATVAWLKTLKEHGRLPEHTAVVAPQIKKNPFAP